MELEIKKETKSFSTEWWDSFLIESENFSKTNVFKNVLSKEDLVFLNSEIIKTLQEIYKHKTSQYGFRVYIDGNVQNSKYMSLLIKNPPEDEELIENYTKRIFDEQKFGIILNRTEKFSENMSHNLLLKMQPLLDKVGMPLTGLEMSIFIGNYGWTPLGIHADIRGENIMHFHLGPGPKIMYNWEWEEYKKLTNNKDNNKDIQPLLPFANEYPFEKGDFYFMPWNKYHIGFSDQLSVGIVIGFNNPTRNSFASKIIDSIHLQFIKDDKQILKPDKNSSTEDSFSEVESIINLDENLKKLSFIDLLKHLHRDFKLAIISNGGWSNIPMTLKDKMQYDVDDYEVLANKKIITPYPYKTRYEKIDEELVLFARGYKVKIKYHKELTKIVDQLNNNKEEEVKQLLEVLSEDWPIEAGLYFLSLLYDKRAISIVD